MRIELKLETLKKLGVQVKQGQSYFYYGKKHSGNGYRACFKVFWGEADIQEVESKNDNFIYSVKYCVKPKSDYCIVIGRHFDIKEGALEGHGAFLLIKEGVSMPNSIKIPEEVWEKIEKFL